MSRRIVELEPPKDPDPSDDPSNGDKGGVVQTPGSGDGEQPAAANNAIGGGGATGAGDDEGDNDAPAIGGDVERSDGVKVVDAAAADAAVTEREQATSPVVGDAAVEPEKMEKAGEREEEGTPTAVGKGDGGTGEIQEEGEEKEENERRRMEELEQLNTEREGVALEMLYCTEVHNVFQDFNADDGMTPGAEGFEGGDGVDAAEGASPGSEVAANEAAAEPPGASADSGPGDGVSAKN